MPIVLIILDTDSQPVKTKRGWKAVVCADKRTAVSRTMMAVTKVRVCMDWREVGLTHS